MKVLWTGRIVAVSIILCVSVPASAQTVCRLVATPGADGRQSLQCGDTVQVDGGPDASLGESDATGVVLNSGQVLTRVRKGATTVDARRDKSRASRPFEFQIRTPHAVASVRGTIWSVDVRNGQTAIYVKDGSVEVRRVADGTRVTLRCDQGVDVVAGEIGPMTVRNWPRRRSDNFLRPFGLRGGCATRRRR